MTATDTRPSEAPSVPRPGPPPVLRARGSRALEARALRDLEPWLARREPSGLARPLRIAVASGGLRAHWSRRLVARFGSLAGVRVQTLHALAVEILEREGRGPAGELLFPLLVRRRARVEPALREALDDLVDGYGVVEAAASDLLDAGFEGAHADALSEAVEDALAAGAARERALALVRVAAGIAGDLAAGRAGHRSRLYRDAREALERDPERALPTRALFVHGIRDATGLQADLIEALVRRRGARVWIESPPDPAEPDAPDPGAAFGERLVARLAGAASGLEDDPARPEPPRVEVLHAPGSGAEVRAVAERVRALIDAGTPPEEIALVARHLEPYRIPIRLHLRRLGIPFSGDAAEAGPPGPVRRRLAALGRLLRRRLDAPVETWLDASERLPGGPPLGPGARADLLLGFHALGAARLAEAAAERRGGDDLALPARLGLAPDAGERPPPRRRLARALLDAAIGAAEDLCLRLAAGPPRECLAAHLEWLRALAAGPLGWSVDSPEWRAVASQLVDGARGPGAAAELDAAEFALLVERALGAAVDEPLGGRGAGVQVLDAMQTRGRTFEHLFAVGLARDAFPRAIGEDPLLSDRLRLRLRAVLEALPVKAEGHDEERFLFAQLLSAAPRVALLAPLADDDGKARPVSPLLERLRHAPHVAGPVPVASLHARPGELPRLRPAHEHAVLAGLYGSRDAFERALALAFAEAGSPDAEPRARARRAVVAELDPGLAGSRGLGPYFGFVGPVGARDPRRAGLYVTAVEGAARCAWRTFLERLLRVEPLPDPHGELPSSHPDEAALLIGSLVHRVLERIASAVPGIAAEGGYRLGLEEALRRAPRPVPWPGGAELDALVARAAEELVREQAIGLPGYGRLLALQAGAPLAVARDLDWPDGRDGFGVLGVEVEGALPLAGGRALRFRADRVDGDGRALRLVDYKTGRPPAKQKSETKRLESFAGQVASGKLLQAMAYARAAELCGAPAAEGRYLYLRGEEGLPQRVFGAAPGDEALRGAFEGAVSAVLEAWEHGSFAPRLLEPGKDDEHHACERCGVKEACLRGDSGARRRLAEWLAAGAAGTPAELALVGVWRLHEEAP